MVRVKYKRNCILKETRTHKTFSDNKAQFKRKLKISQTSLCAKIEFKCSHCMIRSARQANKLLYKENTL